MKKIAKLDYTSIKECVESLPNEKKELCNSILNELIFMTDTLNELKKEIEEKGVVTDMSQGKYSIKRANPALNQYNTMMKNYTGCIKQLNELLPDVSTLDDVFDEDSL